MMSLRFSDGNKHRDVGGPVIASWQLRKKKTCVQMVIVNSLPDATLSASTGITGIGDGTFTIQAFSGAHGLPQTMYW